MSALGPDSPSDAIGCSLAREPNWSTNRTLEVKCEQQCKSDWTKIENENTGQGIAKHLIGNFPSFEPCAKIQMPGKYHRMQKFEKISFYPSLIRAMHFCCKPNNGKLANAPTLIMCESARFAPRETALQVRLQKTSFTKSLKLRATHQRTIIWLPGGLWYGRRLKVRRENAKISCRDYKGKKVDYTPYTAKVCIENLVVLSFNLFHVFELELEHRGINKNRA